MLIKLGIKNFSLINYLSTSTSCGCISILIDDWGWYWTICSCWMDCGGELTIGLIPASSNAFLRIVVRICELCFSLIWALILFRSSENDFTDVLSISTSVSVHLLLWRKTILHFFVCFDYFNVQITLLKIQNWFELVK